MREDFVVYLWKFQQLKTTALTTTEGASIQILKVGLENLNTGPDFFNAQLLIGNQKWAGNVEIHVNSSDWYAHGHEKDPNYDAVILHVVWEHDVAIYRKDSSVVPTLELKNFVDKAVLTNYHKLFSTTSKWINCENDIEKVDAFLMENWLERLYIERLEQKSVLTEELLLESKNDWEGVLFKLLAKNFGLKVNAEAFFDLATKIDFNIIRKQQANLESLEALFFGQSGLLNEDIEDGYYQRLKNEYTYLKAKYNLVDRFGVQFQFFRLRPSNFPTIRIAQLAALYHTHQNIFSKIIAATCVKDFYTLFDVSVSDYWKTHYSFTSTSKKTAKAFVDLLLINTIIPLKFMYLKQLGMFDSEELLRLVRQIKPEKNSILTKFSTFGVPHKSALQTQGLLQLKNEYCSKQACLNCAIGNSYLRKG